MPCRWGRGSDGEVRALAGSRSGAGLPLHQHPDRVNATTAANPRRRVATGKGVGEARAKGGEEGAPGHDGRHGGPVEVAAAPGREPGWAKPIAPASAMGRPQAAEVPTAW